MVKVVQLVLILLTTAVCSNGGYGQKCTFDKNGPRTVPFVWSSNSEKATNRQLLKGTVSAFDKSPIIEATLALFRVAPGEGAGGVFVGSTQTDHKGRFCFGSLPIGRYTLHIGSQYFQRLEIDLEIVSSGSRDAKKRLDVELEVGY